MDLDTPPDPRSVAAAFRLGGETGTLHEVGRAWSNRVYRLRVGEETYAVKELRGTWGPRWWADRLDESWPFELLAIDAGVRAPVPMPNPIDGHCLATVDRVGGGTCEVRVHRWVDGEPLPTSPVAHDVAAWAGETTARLHSLARRPRSRVVFGAPSGDTVARWDELVELATAGGASWAGDLAALEPQVREIAELALGGDAPVEHVMTHGDIDQKNVVAGHAGPVLCDWDVACPMVPSHELADVAMSMACWERFDVARAVVAAYRRAGGVVDRITPSDLAVRMLTGIDWLALNVRRAVGAAPCSREESGKGRELVPGLVARLPARVDIARRVESLLS